MQLASYIGTRAGIKGLGNMLIRFRLSGQVSHSEVVFQPGDGVDDLMPDGTCQPDQDGALWCASSVMQERLPAWSARRAGGLGGVRLKRIVLDPEKWRLQPYRRCPRRAALWVRRNEGRKYSWRLILRFASWVAGLFVGLDARHTYCSQACAAMGWFPEDWRMDPCVLDAAVAAENAAHRALAGGPRPVGQERAHG